MPEGDASIFAKEKMMQKDKWIWLDSRIYPKGQHGPYTGNWDAMCEDGTVVEFSRRIVTEKAIDRVDIRYSADALVQLWINEKFLGTGPVWVGGDFLANDRARTNRYATELSCRATGKDDHLSRVIQVDGLSDGRIEILARVRLSAVQICEFSMGCGGFMLAAEVHFSDGTVRSFTTDEDWDAVVCPSYAIPGKYDARLPRHAVTRPTVIEDVWNAEVSPLPLRIERRRVPDGGKVTVRGGESVDLTLEYDKIYAGYVSVNIEAAGEVEVDLSISETAEDGSARTENLIFVGDDKYIGTRMYSIGIIRARVTNRSADDAVIDIAINEAYLPSRYDCMTVTSDGGLNKILSVAKHTLKYCRQYIHLDSPKHCEPSACTGDYFIESMMSTYSLGDMALADFDAVRTARILEHNNGVMFHPTYSLIWVRMLLEVYKRCGRRALLDDCKTGLDLLLSTFAGYVGENGIIETPPNYMFVDWIYIDGISLHHPPKALGQSVMNMFYFDALNAASEIYDHLGLAEKSEKCRSDAAKLKNNINAQLYDGESGLYFEGLNTPTPREMLYLYMPENVEKRYFRINANALAVAFGVVEGADAERIIRTMLDNAEFDSYQPYFAHFVLSAVHRTGLDGEYLFKILDKWRAPVEECDKGLAEGFIPPEPTYSFDHSHAWGGTPLYSLPTALTSLEILEPGMGRISIRPCLLGLESAVVEIPTPHGVVTVDMAPGRKAKITAPDNVTVEVRE